MTGYTDTIRQWATDLRRSGIIENPSGTGEVGLDSHEVGHRLAVRFTLTVADETITDIRFQVFGCGFTIAACAAVAELAIDRTFAEALSIDVTRIDEVLRGLPEDRRYCAELAVAALQAAVHSAQNGRRKVATGVQAEPDHGPGVTAEHPVYAELIKSAKPDDVSEEDRHLFACLIAVAADEPHPAAAALGLKDVDLDAIREKYFPHAHLDGKNEPHPEEAPPKVNDDILSLLLSHAPPGSPSDSIHLAHILAARATHPGHLWVAMGLFERPQLTAAIRRHLPTLATANNLNMRWKRYLFKHVCDLNGGTMCKVPDCGDCSDYLLCFALE